MPWVVWIDHQQADRAIAQDIARCGQPPRRVHYERTAFHLSRIMEPWELMSSNH
jgi:hypothetical protein